MRFRHLVRIGLIAILLWFPLPLAQAHAQLVSSYPAVGVNLGVLPSKVAVTFDEDLLVIGGANTNGLIVKDPQGIQIDVGVSRVSGATLSVGIKPVTRTGTFTVSWRVVSGDGHPEASSFQFSVGTPSVPVIPAQVKIIHGPDFWTRYGTRLMLLLAAAVAAGIWARFERARRKRG
jgi:methionine-rich copper-binding protein CopC